MKMPPTHTGKALNDALLKLICGVLVRQKGKKVQLYLYDRTVLLSFNTESLAKAALVNPSHLNRCMRNSNGKKPPQLTFAHFYKIFESIRQPFHRVVEIAEKSLSSGSPSPKLPENIRFIGKTRLADEVNSVCREILSRLQVARVDNGTSIVGLAKKLGIDRTGLARILAGGRGTTRVGVRLSVLYDVCREVGLNFVEEVEKAREKHQGPVRSMLQDGPRKNEGRVVPKVEIPTSTKLCGCGCGRDVKPGKKFVQGCDQRHKVNLVYALAMGETWALLELAERGWSREIIAALQKSDWGRIPEKVRSLINS